MGPDDRWSVCHTEDLTSDPNFQIGTHASHVQIHLYDPAHNKTQPRPISYPTAMFGLRFLCCFLSIVGPALAASPPTTNRAFVQSKLQPFVNSLALPPPQAQLLSSKLDQDSNLAAFLGGKDYQSSFLLALSCLSIRATLGDSSVDTIPINQTETEANWSAPPAACPPRNTEYSYTGRKAAGVPRLVSAQDVSRALKITGFFKSRFAVRSGGHSPNPGFSSIDNPGILVDLQKLNQIEVSQDRKVASLGPGGRWGDVLAALDPYDVSVIGGRIPQVGVAGVIIGGIVTRFDLYTIPVRNIWFQVAIYTPDQVPTILDAFADWQNKGASDVKSTVALIIAPEATTVGLIYSAPADQPAAFAPFYSIPAATVAVPANNGTVLSLTNILGTTFSDVPQRHDYRGASSKVDLQLYKDVYAFWREQAIAVHAATGANMTFTLQPIPVNLVDLGIAKGGNPLGLSRINQQWWTTLVDWENAEDDEKVRAVPIATSEKWKELGEQRGSYIPFLFMNDGSRDQSPLSLYGAENVARLKQVSRNYDGVTNRAINGANSNVKKDDFHLVYAMEAGVSNTWFANYAEHARKRRILNAAFSDKALRMSEPYVIQHVDRWCQLLAEGAGHDWSQPREMAEWSDYLVFDILGDLCYAKSFEMKEPGENPLRMMPKFMADYTELHFNMFAPENVSNYMRFIESNLSSRIAMEEEGAAKGADSVDVRKDMFHYLFHAKDPLTGGPGYTRAELRVETSLLVIAGSDTTSTVIPAMFFYMTRNPRIYEKLTSEIRKTFHNVGEIHSGPQLSSCRYLRAFIDETMRLNPPVAGDLTREVLAGGIAVEDQYLPEGTVVGVSFYALHHNEATFPDAFHFQPERWIAAEQKEVSAPVNIAAVESGFTPFSMGPRGCPGKNLAYLEMSITMAKVLYLYDVKAMEGSDLGAGRPDQIWGRQNKEHYQTCDRFMSTRKGPIVNFRRRGV
ncbi:MAG: hypothetical protein Q9205_003823 [Flavoplaca limonia]